MSKPANGRYRLVSTTPPGLTSLVQVDDTGMDMTFGRLGWDAANDWFASSTPDVVVRCTGEGTFEAVWNYGQPSQTQYEGTCSKVP